MKIKKNKVRKLLFVLLLFLLLSFIFGILFVGLLSDESKKLIVDSVSVYFNNVNSIKGDNFKLVLELFLGDFLLYLFVWIMGISVLGVVFSLLVFTIKAFLAGFLFCSVIYTYGVKGILLAFIYMIPHFISLFICLMICYYAISFSLYLYKYVFRKCEFNIGNIMTRYLRLALISFGGIFINSLINVFIINNLLKLFNF